MRRNGYTAYAEPILSDLEQIENRDAILNTDLTEAYWPKADVIVGNPPFVGGKRLRDSLGDVYVDRLFEVYRGRCRLRPTSSPTGWPRPGNRSARIGRARRPRHHQLDPRRREPAGAGADRGCGRLMEAWADEPWVLEGAAVRVSMLGFGRGFLDRRLEGQPTERINADLTGAVIDLTKASRLKENAGVAFMGDTKGGAFDVPGDQAREWLTMPLNPNGRSMRRSEALANAMDVTRRPSDKWIIDFGWTMSEAEAALYRRRSDTLSFTLNPSAEPQARCVPV